MIYPVDSVIQPLNNRGLDFSVGSKPLRPDAEWSISAIQACQEKVVFVNYSIYYSALLETAAAKSMRVSDKNRPTRDEIYFI